MNAFKNIMQGQPRDDMLPAGFGQKNSWEKYEEWANKPETKAKIAAAEKGAWAKFDQTFPNADKTKFTVQTTVDEKNNITAEVFFKAGVGSLESVFGSDRKFWSKNLKAALGEGGNFPYQLTPQTKVGGLPIPAVEFTKPAPSLKKIFNGPINIYVTPDSFFVAKFREIFQKTKIRHNSGSESKHWLAGPNMRYWPQQLNFAVFCATQGCGISREVFDSGLKLPPQIRAFYQFHVYFTVRRILFQMGGIQSVSALPGDPTFNVTDSHYDAPSYKRLCSEFGVEPKSDFRYTSGKNHGLGNAYIWVTGGGPMKIDQDYPGGYNKFGDEGGKAIKGNLLAYIEPDKDSQYDWFAPNTAAGLTQAGLARVNQSIEAFVYCVLGAQVNVRSSILGSGGRAKEAQTEFLTLVEDAIRQPDLAKSVQRYQLAVDEAKVRLNLAVCPGAWLMPARMIINTESTVGYNNALKQAAQGMKLGVNNDVNPGTKKEGLQLMDGGPSKINPPNSHPSNPIHKAATAAQDPRHKAATARRARLPSDIEEEMKDETPQHETNKPAVIIGVVVGVAALLVLASR